MANGPQQSPARPAPVHLAEAQQNLAVKLVHGGKYRPLEGTKLPLKAQLHKMAQAHFLCFCKREKGRDAAALNCLQNPQLLGGGGDSVGAGKKRKPTFLGSCLSPLIWKRL